MADRKYIQYPLMGAFLNKGVISTEVSEGKYSELCGVDGRFTGSLRKFYGMRLVKELTGITGGVTVTSVSYLQAITLPRGDSTYFLRGFVVRYGTVTDQAVRFFYYDTSTSAWASIEVFATGVSPANTSTTVMSSTSYGKFLYVAVHGRTPKVVYYNGSSVVVEEMGSGIYYDVAQIPAFGAVTQAVDAAYKLVPASQYSLAYRFYNPTRKVFSAMQVTSVTMEATKTKASIPIDVTAAQAAAFTKIQLFRSIALSSTGGTVYYLESEMANATTTTTPETKTLVYGSKQDMVLVTLERFDPWMDTPGITPKGGAILEYGGSIFVGGDPSSYGGIKTFFTNPGSESLEYFTSGGFYRGYGEDGVPIAYFQSGESMYIMTKNSLVLTRKKGAIVQFTRLHLGRGIVNYKAGHSVGNELVFVSPLGIAFVDGQQSTMQVVPELARVVNVDWKDSLSGVRSCYDGYFGVSFFLNPTEKEAVCLWHNTQGLSMFEGCNFVDCSNGQHPETGEFSRAFLVTSTGRVVTPDYTEGGTGTMQDITAAKTINGTASSTETGKIVMATATFDSSMVGSRVYFSSGTLAGTWVTVASLDGTTGLVLTENTVVVEAGQTFSVSPILFKARLWNIPLVVDEEAQENKRFIRRVMTSMSINVKNLTLPTSGGFWRLGAYRNGESALSISNTTMAMDANPADSSIYMNVDGVDLEPYIEQSASGIKFELTRAEVGITISGSRNAKD
jgi:hypothetical protein